MENMQKNIKVIWWIKSLLASYIDTGLLITLGVYRTLNGDSVSIVTSLILCAGGGMTGGMIS